jgi:soluble lytic murein transglycosylase-like protein
MSNWFTFHHIHRQPKIKRKKQEAIAYAVVSFLIICAGAWLVYKLLVSRGINPFQTHLTTNPDSPLVPYFSPSIVYWQEEIQSWADTWTLDPLLIATVMQIESCGDPQAVSPAGAQGLFQVMPYHFQPGEDMLDPHTNARRGLVYLHEALQKANGDIKRALAGYNGGHGQIHRDIAHWPDETQRYVHWGYGIYQDAFLSNTQGKALSAWLNAGGWQLCEQAKNNLGLP